MTTTDEQFVSENSDAQNEQAQQTDTLSLNKESSAQKEPETKNYEAVSKATTFSQVDVPEKFKNKDGSTNLNALVKSYKELEPLINEKANWVKEKEILSKEKDDLSKQILQYESKNVDETKKVNEIAIKYYEKLLDKSENKEKAKVLIDEFKKSASTDILKELEKFFPTDIIKDVTQKTIFTNNLIKEQERQKIQDEEFKKVEDYLKNVFEKNSETLKNPVTAGIFNETFQYFGSKLDSEWFFSKISALKDSFIQEYLKEQKLIKETNSAISNASKISPSNSISGGTPLTKRNALDLSPQELDKMLEDYFAK